MRCGEELIWREKRLWLKKRPDRAAVQFSAACMDRVKRLENKGYRITSARVRNMVFWDPKDDNPGEIMILLPDLVLTYRGRDTGKFAEKEM